MGGDSADNGHLDRDLDALRSRVTELETQLHELNHTATLLEEQLDFFQILIDAIPTPLFYQDLEGRILLCNMAFETVVQAIREEIVGKRVQEVIEDPEFARILCSPQIGPESIQEPKGEEAEVRFLDGSHHNVEVKHVVFFNLEGEPRGTVGMMIDLTDRKRAEAAEIEAERLQTAQQMAISIAHEFNNPLMILVGVYQLLQGPVAENLDDPLKEHFQRIPRAVERMRDLVVKLQKLTAIKRAEYAAGQTFIDLHASAEDNTPPTSGKNG